MEEGEGVGVRSWELGVGGQWRRLTVVDRSPFLVAMVAALFVALPWLVQKMTEYSESLIANIPRVLGG